MDETDGARISNKKNQKFLLTPKGNTRIWKLSSKLRDNVKRDLGNFSRRLDSSGSL